MLTGDDKDVSIRRVFGDGFGKVSNDGSIGVEKIITRHTRLSGDTSRDKDDLGSHKSMGNLLLGIPIDFASSVDVTNVGGDTRSTTDIVKA